MYMKCLLQFAITKLTVISTQTIHIILVHDTVVHVYQIRV